MKYIPELPNGEKLTAKCIDRSFLFSIMNTIDPQFFPRAVDEIELRLVKHELKHEGSLKVKSEMLFMLK
jgi:hypothetical protein